MSGEGADTGPGKGPEVAPEDQAGAAPEEGQAGGAPAEGEEVSPYRDPRRIALLVALGAVGVYLVIRQGILTAEAAIFFAVLIPSVILHEVAHGALALVFGDDTAQRAGRLTLNPLPHIDAFGTVILPALLVLTTGSAFGFARPVPVDPRRMRRPRDHALLVSLVGPGVNLALALLAAAAIRAADPEGMVRLALLEPGFGIEGTGLQVLAAIGLVNVILAVFNMLPVPPLDGSAVVERVLPQRWWRPYARLRQYSFVVLVVVVLVLAEPLSRLVFDPAVELWAHLL